MKWWLLAMTLAIGCGGSSKRSNAPADDPERRRIDAMKPAKPYEVRSIKNFQAVGTTCGQGPYRIAVGAIGAKFGEQIEVNICAPRSLQGDYRLIRGTTANEARRFGSRNNSEHCLPTAAESAALGTATTTASSSSSASSSGSAPKRSDVARSASIALTEVEATIGETCPGGLYLTGIVDWTSETTRYEGVPIDAGTSLVVELWSPEPLHLDGAVFVVIQRGVREGMTLTEWNAYHDAYERWTVAWNAYLEGEVTAGRMTYRDSTARSPDAPPPPRADARPPRPSLNAEWIAGFWQRHGEWIWSPGFWRVPQSDIVAEKTVEAPVAPPAAKVETPPPPTTTVAVTTTAPPPPNLVWTPGYWAWDGRAYVWIEGAWRIPPQTNARWVAPAWVPRRGRVVLVPGGWSVRIGR